MAAVTPPPLLPSLRPSTPAFISLAVSLCRRKLEAAGNRQADGQGSPWGFLTPSNCFFLQLYPIKSPSSSLSVPLNLSLFLSRFLAHLLRLIISLSPILPLPVATHPALTCSLSPSLCLPHFVSIVYVLLCSLTSPTRRATVPRSLRHKNCCTASECA